MSDEKDDGSAVPRPLRRVRFMPLERDPHMAASDPCHSGQSTLQAIGRASDIRLKPVP